VAAARGDLVAVFDADDLMEPDKLAAAAAVFGAHPEVDFLFTDFREIDEQGRVLTGSFLAPYRDFRASLSPGEPALMSGRDAYHHLLRGNFVGTSSVICRRELFDRVGGFDEEMLNSDDVDMWRRIAYSGATFAFLDRVLHSYRKVSGGITGRAAARRLPAVLRGLNKQLALDLTPEERADLQKRIHDLELEYAYGLCNARQYGESLDLYRRLLGRRVTGAGVKGLVRTCLRRVLS
jgi:cellulose synthase/poly-beta-1,6-N-acetylglucosamine synthase-like glycosyltransferase